MSVAEVGSAMHTIEIARKMRGFVLAIGWFATLAVIAISMCLNWLYGYSLGQTPEKAQAFAGVSVVADTWKALGLILIFTLWRARRFVAAFAGSVLWLVCLIYAVSSALGLAVQDRMMLTGGRETVRAGLEDARVELEEKVARRKATEAHRSSAEVEAAIATVLAQSVKKGKSTIGTVGGISTDCSTTDDRTTKACAEVATLRQERARAIEAKRLDKRIDELRQSMGKLREHGGAIASDPQMFSRLLMGWVSVKDIGFGLVLLLAGVIQLMSAFGLIVLHAFAEATRRPASAQSASGASPAVEVDRNMSRSVAAYHDTAGQIAVSRIEALALEHPPIGGVIDYLHDRTKVTDEGSVIETDTLYADYSAWCGATGYAALDKADFVREFDGIRREPDVGTRIRKSGTRYYGLALIGSRVVRLPSKRSEKRPGETPRLGRNLPISSEK